MAAIGGFVDGSRTSQVVTLEMKDGAGSVSGEMCEGTGMPARAGHSVVECKSDYWVFGGQDDDNNKLNDIWKYTTADKSWSKVTPKEGSPMPTPRCGHTAVQSGS